MSTVTTRSRAAQSEATPPSSQRGKRKRSRGGKQQSGDRKRAREAANESEENAAAVPASPAAEQASSDEASSAVSSPRRCPVLPRVVIAKHLDGTKIYDPNIDSAIVDAYIEERGKYFAKLDGKLLARCSGFLIKLNKEAKVATILTSADLICTKGPSIHDESSMPEFAPHAKVAVHLLDDSIADGHLLNYHKHYNIAVIEVTVKESPQLPCFDSECVAGGPVVDFDGSFVGMASPTQRMAFIPVSIILGCLRMWEKFKCVPRLHLGLKFSAIKFLDPAHSEKISRKFNIDDGLIIQKVSAGSSAEKVGIRIGDIIKCCNGKQIPTNVDLEDELLQMCEDHLDKGNGLGSIVDVTVGVFNIRKESHRTKRLTVKLSDDMEIVAGATYNVSAKEGFPAFSTSSSYDDESPGQDIPCGTSDI
ncbi:hypothetical protein EJB05_33918, partial [Eragrostis curvula]